MSHHPTDVYHLAPEGAGWHLDITDPVTRHPVHCHISADQIAYMHEQDLERNDTNTEGKPS